ncbi:MAG: YIP1 family protein [Candidatus Thiodiazotropha sp. (ex Codakia rugifera)]|nr:YIP1 family protein [Candidatus Thiodiazotropha sp. (ex Codakia rugifera)]
MNILSLIARVRAILLKPQQTWPEIAVEPASISSIYRNYVLILAALPALGMLIGTALFGIKVPMMGTIHVGFGALLIQAILSYTVSLLMIYLMAVVIESLAPTFGGIRDRLQGLKTAAYALTPVWVVGVLHILPGLGALVALLGLAAAVYAIYLIKLGLPETMKCPKEKSLGYTAAVVVIGIVLGLVLNLLVTAVSGISPTTTNDAHFDKDSPMGKLETWGKQMESAQQSGDSEAQQEAMQEMVGTLLGGNGAVEAVAHDKLGEFLPENLLGMQRSDLSTESNQAIGVQVALAKAKYSNGRQQLRVEIMDMGGAKGMLALAGFAAIGSERKTERGYEKTYSDAGRMVNEEWDEVDGHGEYNIIIGQRFIIKVKGNADSITTLRALANALDTDGLDKLKDAASG